MGALWHTPWHTPLAHPWCGPWHRVVDPTPPKVCLPHATHIHTRHTRNEGGKDQWECMKQDMPKSGMQTHYTHIHTMVRWDDISVAPWYTLEVVIVSGTAQSKP